jgi:hypothetical protein
MSKEIISRYFAGRELVIATKHEKERVLAPLFLEKLQVLTKTVAIDTDEFGTFTGEVERLHSPVKTASLKCDEAHRQTGATLVLASEGSFGAHPFIGLVTANEELLVLKDYKNGLFYKAQLCSLKTNMAAQSFTQWTDLESFAERVRFPSHSLIMRMSKVDVTEIHKGIRDWERLKKSFLYFMNKNGSVYVETDMRAMHNPTRMEVIAEAGEKLIDTIMNACPVCETPGFEVVEVIDGLPCEMCAAPTRSTKAYVRHCQSCHHSAEEMYPLQKQSENPMYCNECNP